MKEEALLKIFDNMYITVSTLNLSLLFKKLLRIVVSPYSGNILIIN